MTRKFRVIIPKVLASKYLSWVALLIIVLFSCNSDDDESGPEGIAGEWILVEVLTDPGDGSGEFVRVDSSKNISILPDGSYTSNGDICSFSTDADNPTAGTYQETENGYSIDCTGALPSTLNLSIESGNLIVSFFCFEPCLHKFERLR